MPYPILDIDPTQVLESEQLGTKDKFWLRIEQSDIDDSSGSEWLFKFPTEGTGQHWAEKIAYEIARKMNILYCRASCFVKIEALLPQRGSVSQP